MAPVNTLPVGIKLPSYFISVRIIRVTTFFAAPAEEQLEGIRSVSTANPAKWYTHSRRERKEALLKLEAAQIGEREENTYAAKVLKNYQQKRREDITSNPLVILGAFAAAGFTAASIIAAYHHYVQ